MPCKASLPRNGDACGPFPIFTKPCCLLLVGVVENHNGQPDVLLVLLSEGIEIGRLLQIIKA